MFAISKFKALTLRTLFLISQMCHFKKRSDICEFKYPKHILNVAMNRNRLVVCLKDSIYIHNIQDMRLLHSIKNLTENPNGLITLSSKNCLAYPISTAKGRIQLFDANKAENGVIIDAHNSKVVIMKFSSCGDMLATASEKGTVIRIFSVLSGICLIEFRRSVKRYAQIISLNFSLSSDYVTVSSNTETIHIFRIDKNVKEQLDRERNSNGNESDKMSILSSVSKAFSVLLQDRAFTHVQLSSDAKKHCVIAKLDGQLSLLVACDDGFLYIYKFDQNGGECSLTKVHDLRADLDFARIGGSESLEALALDEVLKNKEEIVKSVDNDDEVEDNPVIKSTYADIIRGQKARIIPQDNQKIKNNQNFPIDHENFKYEEGCRV